MTDLKSNRKFKILLCIVATVAVFFLLDRIPVPERLHSFLCFVVSVMAAFYLIYQITRSVNINLRRTFFYLFSAIVLVSCVIGSWQFYTQKQFNDNWRFNIAVLQSIISLLTATSKSAIEANTPVIYEFARMTAPMLTTFCIYFLVEEAVLRYIGMFRFRFSRKPQILIFGYHDQALSLVNDLIETGKNESSNVILICDHKIDNKLRLSLEQKGIILLEVDYRYKEKEDDPDDIKTIVLDYLKLNKASEICLLEDDSTNVLLFYKLAASPQICNRNVSFSVKADNPATSETIVQIYNSILEELEDPKKHLSLYLFSSSDLMIYDLITDRPFNMPVLESYDKKGLNSLKSIRTPHIVITGFNDCAMSALKYIMRTGLLNTNPEKRTKVTLIDKLDEKTAMQKIHSFYPMIDQVIDLAILNRDPENVDYISTLHAVPQVPISYFLSCYPSMEKNIICLKGMIEYLKYLNHDHVGITPYKVPLAVRISENKDFSGVLAKAYSKKQANDPFEIDCFGSGADLYTYENLFRNKTEEKAKQFHDSYLQNEGKDKREWEKLEYDTIESNRSCVLSAPYFKKLCELMKVDQAKLKESFEDLKNTKLKKKAMTQEEKNITVKDFLKTRKWDQLAELEHLRWMAFHYSLGYLSCDESFGDKLYLIHEQEAESPQKKNKKSMQKGKTIHFGRNHSNLVSYKQLKEKNAETIRYDIQNIILYQELEDNQIGND